VAEAVDILIAGGGPAGAALALALESGGHSVALIEARAAGAADSPSADPGDRRPIALSHASRLILERLGAWRALAVTPIETIHVSQQGGFGRTLMRAADYDLPALGYVAGYGALRRSLAAAPCRARRLYGAKLTSIETGSGGSSLVTVRSADADVQFAARLTVLADGAPAGEDAASKGRTKDYHQSALVARVSSTQAHQGRAWERFTPQGPLALLPQSSDHALVWTTGTEHAAQLCALEAADFLEALHRAFGDRLGTFTAVADRADFPLFLRTRGKETHGRCVAIGNAAQTLHPVAGQGFNLGLRDAWELARLARDCADPGARDFLARYRRARSLDRTTGIRLTDTLVSLFSNSDPFLRIARGAGLLALDLLPAARGFLARRMMFGARALP
jgi:2-octaprenyl-6-methoxyphenol hydroxylase